MSSPFGGVTAAQAAENLSLLGSTMRCPTSHRNVTPVEDLDGERVATLCLDCDAQLPATWDPASAPPPPLPPFVPDPRLTAHVKE